MRSIQLTDEQSEKLKLFTKRCGASSELEVINWALTILQWAVEEIENGKLIASVDPATKGYTVLKISILQGSSLNPVRDIAPKFTVIKGGKIE